MLNGIQLDSNTVSSSLVSAYLGEEIGKETAEIRTGEIRKREGVRYAVAGKAKGITSCRETERRSKSRLERVEFREYSNWIRETEGKEPRREEPDGMEKRETEEWL